ncbi:MAG: YbaB/EbfC family nucleoid-associated protein [Kiritimatiellae bacterium]|nr:YbaB/EbfC family nucleoid-associated protein [Kiritimatiellia bacterium]
MANLFQMMKQAATMQRQMKQIQKELARHKVEHTVAGGTVKVIVRGDMTIESIGLDESLLEPAKKVKVERLLVEAVNGALEAAKKKVGGEMSRMASGLGLGDLLGKM